MAGSLHLHIRCFATGATGSVARGRQTELWKSGDIACAFCNLVGPCRTMECAVEGLRVTLGGLSAEAIAVFGRLEPFPQHWGLPDKESNQKEADASRKLQPRPRHPVRWQKPPRASNPKILSSRLRTPGRMTWDAGSCGRSLPNSAPRTKLSFQGAPWVRADGCVNVPGISLQWSTVLADCPKFFNVEFISAEKIPLPGPASSTSWKQCPTGSHLEQNSCLSTAIGVDLVRQAKRKPPRCNSVSFRSSGEFRHESEAD